MQGAIHSQVFDALETKSSNMAQQNELQALQELSNVDITTSKTACRFATQILSHGPLTHYLCQRLRLDTSIKSISNDDVVDPIHYSILSLLYTCLWTLYNQRNTLSIYILEQEYTFVSQELSSDVVASIQSSSSYSSQCIAWLGGTKGVNLLLTSSDAAAAGHNKNDEWPV